MKHRVHIQDDWARNGVQIALVADHGPTRTLYDFSGMATISNYDPERSVGLEPRLALPNEAARALYEALADHFGHAGHDARALRRDYEAERARVDRMLAHLTGGQG